MESITEIISTLSIKEKNKAIDRKGSRQWCANNIQFNNVNGHLMMEEPVPTHSTIYYCTSSACN